MKKVLLLLVVFNFAISCKHDSYWSNGSFGFLDSLVSNHDTLNISISIRESFYFGCSSMKFFADNNTLFTCCEQYKLYYLPDYDRFDSILLWKNTPLDVSHNRAILDQYKVFEYEFNNFKDSLHNCSTTNTYAIYFKGDTSSIIDMSCQFNSIYYLQQLIQENTKIEDIYSITWAQADSIFHEHYR